MQDSVKIRKNVVSFGLTYASLLDKNGLKFTTGVISYTRHIAKNLFLSTDYNRYFRRHEYNISNKLNTQLIKQGDVLETSFKVLRLKAGKIISIKNFQVVPYVSVNYRWSNSKEAEGEDIFWYWWSGTTGEHSRNISYFNGIGLGAGSEISYIILNRFSIGIDGHYGHYFQKPALKTETGIEPGFYDHYKPNRNVLTLHAKIGVLF